MITAEPEYIKIILATQFDQFEKGVDSFGPLTMHFVNNDVGPEIRWLFRPLLGTGVFAVDGDLWRYGSNYYFYKFFH